MIIQIGPYPPPYGGISVYIRRIKDFLDFKGIENYVWTNSNTKKIENNVIKMRVRRVPFCYLIKKGVKLIHYNISGTKSKNYIGFFNRFLFQKNKVLTIHGSCADLFNKDGRLIIKSLNSFNAIICVRKHDKKYLLKKGIHSNIYEIPAFIPPTSDETEINRLPEFFHKIRHKHEFLITANAFRISFYKNQDLYGIDLSIELMKRLFDNGYKDMGFIYVIPDIGDYDYFGKMQNLVKKYNFEDNFHFYTKPIAYPAVINMCDLFIRPTNTDGCGVSVSEAILLKKPAIASDVCKRSEGVILFKNRNVDDLYNKVIYVIENYTESKKQIGSIEFEDNAEKILGVYKKVLNGK